MNDNGPASLEMLQELHRALCKAFLTEFRNRKERPSAELLQAASLYLRGQRVPMPEDIRPRAIVLHRLVVEHIERALAEPTASAAMLEQARLMAKQAEKAPEHGTPGADGWHHLALPFDSMEGH